MGVGPQRKGKAFARRPGLDTKDWLLPSGDSTDRTGPHPRVVGVLPRPPPALEVPPRDPVNHSSDGSEVRPEAAFLSSCQMTPAWSVEVQTLPARAEKRRRPDGAEH